MKNEKRTIHIGDVGTQSRCEIHGGVITVLVSGGCPVETLLRDVRNYSDPQKLAGVVLRRWQIGYDGDPRANRLVVEVIAHDVVLATVGA